MHYSSFNVEALSRLEAAAAASAVELRRAQPLHMGGEHVILDAHQRLTHRAVVAMLHGRDREPPRRQLFLPG